MSTGQIIAVVFVLLIAGIAILAKVIRNAPEGWQDEETELFHYGREPVTAQDHEERE